MSEYRVELDAYNGPLELLLYLIRKEEIDVYDIPIARVALQFTQYVEVIQKLDPNIAGDFLVMLATLMEIKSRALLPRHLAAEEEEDFEDPRLELVRQLLAYKAFKDAAHGLDLAVQVQALRYPRCPADLPTEPDELDLEDVSIWTLVGAFTSLLEQTGRAKPYHEVVLDDTPLSLHADDIVDSLQRCGGSQVFETIFVGRNRLQMIGLFLALLELIRQRRIRITQDRQFGPITIHLIDATPLDEPSASEAFSSGESVGPPSSSGEDGALAGPEGSVAPDGPVACAPGSEMLEDVPEIPESQGIDAEEWQESPGSYQYDAVEET